MSGEVEKRKAAEPDSPLAPTQLATPSPSQPAPKRARFRDPLTDSDTPIGVDPTFPAKSDEAIDLTMRNTDFSTGTATDMSGGFSITSSAFNHLDSVSSRREIVNFLNKNADAIVENRDPNSRFFAFMNPKQSSLGNPGTPPDQYQASREVYGQLTTPTAPVWFPHFIRFSRTPNGSIYMPPTPPIENRDTPVTSAPQTSGVVTIHLNITVTSNNRPNE